jgi:hypothetical protein
MERYAPDSDPETLAVFAEYFKKFPKGREDFKTWFEVLKLDDYWLSGLLSGFYSGSVDFRSRTRTLGWVGLEPTTNALKGRCSTIELPTRQEMSREGILNSHGCNRKAWKRQPIHEHHRGSLIFSSLLDHRVGIVIVDRFVILCLDAVPIDPGVSIGHDCDIAH